MVRAGPLSFQGAVTIELEGRAGLQVAAAEGGGQGCVTGGPWLTQYQAASWHHVCLLILCQGITAEKAKGTGLTLCLAWVGGTHGFW